MSTRGRRQLSCGKPRGAKGFSAVELVVAMAVVLVISGIALPSMSNSLRVYQLNSVASMVADQFKSSRFDAIRRNLATTCYITPIPGGYRIWTDTAGTGVYTNTDHTTLLSGSQTLVGTVPAGSALASAISVTGTTTMSGNSSQVSLTFDPRGAVTGSTAVNVLYIGYPGNTGFGYRAVVVLPSGSVQVWTPNGSGSWVQSN
jgi:type IV fimbrial biogenesis protein FimT